MGTFAILISISVGVQIGFWILSFVSILKHVGWNGGKKILWALVVFILGPLGTFLYLMFDQKKKWAIIFLILFIVPWIIVFMSLDKFFNPSENVGVFDSTTGQIQSKSISQTDKIKLSVGDEMTIIIVEALNSDLKKYYNDNGHYPIGNKILVGSDEARYLISSGFVAATNGSTGDYFNDLKHPYTDENEAFRNIIYSAENNNQSYRITFMIVIDDRYSKGEHYATPSGIDQDDNQNFINNTSDLSSIDSDNDGLSDKDEINIWHTDPYNPDTDGDGYLDGDEVESGYNPLGEGEIKEL